jgi:CRISPR-associated protein Csb3
MKNPDPSIQIDVDPTNPGQFFACCGLFELADRLWPGAEAWFEGTQFYVAAGGTLSDLLLAIGTARIESSLTDEGLKRLGTLLSAQKAKLSPAEVDDKQRLSNLWKTERLHLSKPFDLWVDWWWDENDAAKGLKTWAAKQFVLEMARSLLQGVKRIAWNEPPITSCLVRTGEVDAVPFYFDSHNNSQATARDTGFGLYTMRHDIKTSANTRPLLELAAFLGIQRFRPAAAQSQRAFRFVLWPTPLPVMVAATAAAGLLSFPGQRQYEFRMLMRSEYMKAFHFAQPVSRGDS